MTGKTVKLLVFDLKADLGHFRRPDTTATHATYPFITRTALRGLLGSILGLDHWNGDAWTGIQLLNPIIARAQQLSLLGKGYFSGGSQSFNRPTSIELVIKPHYRIFYTGDLFGELHESLEQGLSVYHTYLGSVFAMTKPRFVDLLEAEERQPEETIECISVVPSHVVRQLEVQPGRQYMRAGGIPYRSLGEYSFEGTMNFIYERSGQPIRFRPSGSTPGAEVRWAALPSGGWVSLW
jgi:CRISPR-associated protein Cas5h